MRSPGRDAHDLASLFDAQYGLWHAGTCDGTAASRRRENEFRWLPAFSLGKRVSVPDLVTNDLDRHVGERDGVLRVVFRSRGWNDPKPPIKVDLVALHAGDLALALHNDKQQTQDLAGR